jgi:hypothetical protein
VHREIGFENGHWERFGGEIPGNSEEIVKKTVGSERYPQVVLQDLGNKLVRPPVEADCDEIRELVWIW